jgi:hypothetical protein
MSGMRPELYDEEYSAILLGTTRSPGIVKLSGHDRNKEWENTKAKGTAGSSSKLQGDPIGSFTATFSIVADAYDEDGRDDFDRWEDFQRLIESTTNGPAPIALPIYHPDLARNHFTEVVNAGIGGMVHDGLGGATVTVKFQEHRPAKPKPAAKAKAKPAGSPATSATGAAGAAGAGKPDPNAIAKAELAGLLAVARAP